jgi:hypothetical protein
MTDIQPLHKPRWQPDAENWLMIVGNLAVATLVPTNEPNFPHYKWMSVILAESPFDDQGWSAVDFGSRECAQYDLEQWWHHASRGERYDPQLHRNCPHCGGPARNF